MQTSIIVMGVSGCGKTTLGQNLAARLELPFFDADDYHTADSKEKMVAGVPLTDADRAIWLERLAAVLEQQICVLACSALKEKYRLQLAQSSSFRLVYLRGDHDLIAARLTTREHFFNPALLESQFAILEEPSDAIVLDVACSLADMIDGVVRVLNSQGEAAPTV